MQSGSISLLPPQFGRHCNSAVETLSGHLCGSNILMYSSVLSCHPKSNNSDDNRKTLS